MWLTKSMSAEVAHTPRKQGLSSKSGNFTAVEVLNYLDCYLYFLKCMAAYQVVNQVQRSNRLSIERSARLNQLQRSLVILDNDFRQMAVRQFSYQW
ncbi:hypothetical protein O9992_10015 [Vibrio lentus]|nr:hypothetical protein [Vibrio lentus]